MSNKVLLAGTLITSFIILVGYGHGICPIILVEIPYPMLFSTENVPNEYRYLIIPSLVFFAGHILYIVALLTKYLPLLRASLAILWGGLLMLVWLIFGGDAIGAFALISGTPFIVLSVILFKKSLIKKTAPEN